MNKKGNEFIKIELKPFHSVSSVSINSTREYKLKDRKSNHK